MILEWPTAEHRFWWMQYRLSKRGKTKVMLVELLVHEGTEYIQPFQDRNCYPRSICHDWEAKFKPCESQPVFE
jgi:hypothetical protein